MSERASRGNARRLASTERPLPAGDVTFLFTDIEGSTTLMDRVGDSAYGDLLALHDEVIRGAVNSNGGTEVNAVGDGVLIAFADPLAAMRAAVDAQDALARIAWPYDAPVRVRMGLHRGRVTPSTHREYVALAIHQAARVASAPHGGQVICTSDVLVDIADTATIGVDTRLLGAFWLRDFADPVRVFQIQEAGGATDFPPLRAARADLTNVTRSTNELVGRRSVLADIEAAMNTAQLVTVTGPGGVGKTRVASEFAARVAGNGEGAWFTELATIEVAGGEGGAAIEQAIATTIARAVGSATDKLDAIVSTLAKQRALLVLDNCEHLSDEVVPIVEHLLDHCPELRILATSREALRLSAEYRIPLEPLEVPAGPAASLREIGASNAVQLFCQRAEEAHRGFALSEDNATDVAELCRELDGLPLALELAAAATRYLAPVDLIRRVREVGDLPDSVGPRRPGRHSSLDSLVTWSLDSCTPEQAAVFRRLGAFAGPAPLDAAVAVCGGTTMSRWQVADALGALVEKSLVITRTDQSELRYDLLVTLRRAALARLESAEERDEAMLRHAEYVATAVMALDESPWAVMQDAARLLVSELDVALDRAVSIGLATSIYADLVCCRISRAGLRDPSAALRHCAILLARPDLSPVDRARTFNLRTAAAENSGDPATSSLAAEALIAAREAGDPTELVSALIYAGDYPPGRVETTTEEDPERAKLLAEALALMPQVTRLRTPIGARINTVLGAVAAQWGRPDEARAYHRRSLAISLAANDDFNTAVGYYNLAEVDELNGQFEAAVDGYSRATELLSAPGTPAWPLHRSAATYSKALVLTRANRLHEAADAAADAVLAARQSNHPSMLVRALLLVTDVAIDSGDPALARSAAEEVIEVSTDEETRSCAADLLASLAAPE
jgi:predicted ATPase/class 3 adenylate cyclase